MSTTGPRYQGQLPRTAGASAYFLMLSATVNLAYLSALNRIRRSALGKSASVCQQWNYPTHRIVEVVEVRTLPWGHRASFTHSMPRDVGASLDLIRSSSSVQ